MNVVISDPKTGRSFSTKVEDPKFFMNKKVGDEVALDGMGLLGYTAKIRGGSDKTGTPMKSDLKGTVRKKAYILKNKKRGTRQRISFRGNTVADDIHQLNLVVVKAGSQKLEEVYKKEGTETEEDLSAKEKAVKQSLEAVGKGLMGEAQKKGTKRN